MVFTPCMSTMHSCQLHHRRAALLTAGCGVGLTALVAAGGVALVVGATAAQAGVLGFSGADPRALVRSGMDKFKRGDLEGSIADFERAVELKPDLHPYMWVRRDVVCHGGIMHWAWGVLTHDALLMAAPAID